MPGELGAIDAWLLDVMTTGGVIPAWFWQKSESGGGVLHVNGAHSFDRLRWLMGSEIVEVFAYAQTYDARKTVEDSAVVAHALREWRNGNDGAQLGDRCGPCPFKCDLDIHGSRGSDPH